MIVKTPGSQMVVELDIFFFFSLFLPFLLPRTLEWIRCTHFSSAIFSFLVSIVSNMLIMTEWQFPGWAVGPVAEYYYFSYSCSKLAIFVDFVSVLQKPAISSFFWKILGSAWFHLGANSSRFSWTSLISKNWPLRNITSTCTPFWHVQPIPLGWHFRMLFQSSKLKALVRTWNLMVSSSPHCQVLCKSIHAVLFMQPHTSAPIFPVVIMPSTPTPPTINLQLFLDSLFFWLKFSLFLVHFSIEKTKETKK